MRRFILTYTREGQSIDIEGVQFSLTEHFSAPVALEHYPDDTDWTGPRGFYSLAAMEYKLNELGTMSIKWIDAGARR